MHEADELSPDLIRLPEIGALQGALGGYRNEPRGLHGPMRGMKKAYTCETSLLFTAVKNLKAQRNLATFIPFGKRGCCGRRSKPKISACLTVIPFSAPTSNRVCVSQGKRAQMCLWANCLGPVSSARDEGY